MLYLPSLALSTASVIAWDLALIPVNVIESHKCQHKTSGTFKHGQWTENLHSLTQLALCLRQVDSPSEPPSCICYCKNLDWPMGLFLLPGDRSASAHLLCPCRTPTFPPSVPPTTFTRALGQAGGFLAFVAGSLGQGFC